MILRLVRSSALSLLAVASMPVPAAEPIRVYAAGSLVAPLDQAIATAGIAADPVFGPAGLLRQRLQKGERADLFLSADLRGPRALSVDRPDVMVVPFARNKLCLFSKAPLPGDAGSLLDRLLDPAFRLATSTPEADPGGDYALAVFAKAEALRPGAATALAGKSLRLLGAPGAMVPVAGKSPAASIFLADRADALLYYCSSAADIGRETTGLVVQNLPAPLDVTAVYGLAVLTDDAEARRLALFLLSDRGQYLLIVNGLLPIDGTPAAKP